MKRRRVIRTNIFHFKKVQKILFVLFLLLGLGYSTLVANMSILGSLGVLKAKWDIHFANIQVTEGSVTPINQPTISNKTSLSYQVKLESSDDFYEFTVDLVNDGTFNAKAGNFTISPTLTSAQEEYLNYEVTYDSGGEINSDDLILAGRYRKILVHVSFKDGATIPPGGETITGGINFPCKQAGSHINDLKCTYDGELEDGTVYENGQYSYIYSSVGDGWSATLIDKNSTDPVTTKLCSRINGKPINNMTGMFAGSQATSIDMSSFDTSNVKDMSGMFYNTKVEKLDFSTFDTSKVMNMSSMFYNVKADSIDVHDFDTSSVHEMVGMFSGCSNIKKLNLSNFNTSNVSAIGDLLYGTSNLQDLNLKGWDFSKTNSAGLSNMLFNYPSDSIVKKINLDNAKFGVSMGSAFSNLQSLEEINLNNVDTSNVTNMENMFGGCWNIKKLDLHTFNTSNVTSMSNIFGGLYSIEELNLSDWDFSGFDNEYLTHIFAGGRNYVLSNIPKKIDLSNAKFTGSMYSAFSELSGLEELILTGVDTSNVTNMGKMFFGDASIESLDLSSFNTGSVFYMGDMFSGVSSITSLDLSGFDLSSITSVSSFGNMFGNATSLENINMSGWDFSNSNSANLLSSMGLSSSNLKKIDLSNAVFGASMVSTFSGSYVEEIDLTNVDTSNVTTMQYSFANMKKIKQVDLSSFDLLKVTDMSNMFDDDILLENLDLHGKSAPVLRSIQKIAQGCSSLMIANFNDFYSPILSQTADMLFGANQLKELYMKNFNFGNVSDLGHTTGPFYGKSNLLIVDLRGADISNVTYMGGAFFDCSSLVTLKMDGVIGTTLTNINSMFYGVSALNEIDLSGFDFLGVTVSSLAFKDVTATVGYAKDQANADWLNALPASDKPPSLTFVVKP